MINKKAIGYTILPFVLAIAMVSVIMPLGINMGLNLLLLITPISYIASYFLVIREKPNMSKPNIRIVLLTILTAVVISSLMGFFMPKGDGQEILKNVKANNSFPLLTKFLVVIIGPFAEELYFRVGYKKIIKNDNICLIVSSLIFGLSHLDSKSSLVVNLVIGLSTTLTALVFAYAYKQEKNMLDVWIPHSIINLLAVI